MANVILTFNLILKNEPDTAFWIVPIKVFIKKRFYTQKKRVQNRV